MKKLLNTLAIFGLAITPISTLSCGPIEKDDNWTTKDITINMSMSNAPTTELLREAVREKINPEELNGFTSNAIKDLKDYNFQDNIILGKTSFGEFKTLIAEANGHFAPDSSLETLWNDTNENDIMSVILFYGLFEEPDETSGQDDFLIIRYLVARFNITKEAI